MAARMRCYVCIMPANARQLARMNGDEHILKREIAIGRRDGLGHPPLQLDDNSRLCANCNISINNEINALNADPDCLRLNVLTQSARQTCVSCNADRELHRMSFPCRVNVFIKRNIYIPENVKSCEHHLDDNGHILEILLPGLRFIYRPYNIKGTQLMPFLDELRKSCENKPQRIDMNNLSDDEFQCIAPMTKDQFEDLFSYCDPILENGQHRFVQKKDLLMFLCKLRQGLSDDFLKVIFDYNSRQRVSCVISTVRQSLSARFVPENIGPRAIARDDYIREHVTEFSNILYNPKPEEKKAIVIIDSTYAYVHKSSNFQALRRSFSLHKSRHLIKPTLVVAPDGYILAIFGPYFSDSKNNDAAILRRELEHDGDELSVWLQHGDVVLVDRGYRDVLPFLQRLGIQCEMPAFLERGQKQLSTEDANSSRKVTKNRWVVESRNGHIRSMFKFFEKTVNLQHARFVNQFYCIAGAIINKYHPVITMENATPALAREILDRVKIPNVVQARVELDNLTARNAQWTRIDHRAVPDFPVLDLAYLKDLTVGVYQINLAPAYIQDKLLRENEDELYLDEHNIEPGFLRIRVFSRFRNATRYQLFIAYNVPDGNNSDDNDNDDENLIEGYYCQCPAGSRTLGACAHVASILWFLGYARHHQNIKYPTSYLLNHTLDAADRE